MLSNNRLEELWNDNFTVESGLNYLKLARAIESAARRESLDEAAKMCEPYKMNGDFYAGMIRALIVKQ